ncbi:24462_t:CDS:1, partial [Racocetra persica]
DEFAGILSEDNESNEEKSEKETDEEKSEKKTDEEKETILV